MDKRILTAVVNFRTLPNGSYKWMKKGLRRGWWRLLDVQDPSGSTMVTARNVVRVIANGQEGINGVTSRSAYCIDDDYARLCARRDRINAARDRAFNMAVHHAE